MFWHWCRWQFGAYSRYANDLYGKFIMRSIFGIAEMTAAQRKSLKMIQKLSELSAKAKSGGMTDLADALTELAINELQDTIKG